MTAIVWGVDIAVFDTRAYDREALDAANTTHGHLLRFFEPRLTSETAALATGAPVVCPFVNCRVDAEAIDVLRSGGTRLLALRSAGFNHVDLDAAAAAGMRVVRVPEYSPYAVAELAICLVLKGCSQHVGVDPERVTQVGGRPAREPVASLVVHRAEHVRDRAEPCLVGVVEDDFVDPDRLCPPAEGAIEHRRAEAAAADQRDLHRRRRTGV